MEITVIGLPPFDYRLANSGDITVTQGGAGTNTITATLAAGSAQSVSFSASGLPTGATAGFSPGACNPTCSSQLTISTTGATPMGTFPITVTGSPLSKTTTFNLVLNPPLFNYTLANSGNITVTQGGAGTNTITATLTAGCRPERAPSRPRGCRPATTAGFSPGACNPTCSSQLTISTGRVDAHRHVPDHRDRQSAGQDHDVQLGGKLVLQLHAGERGHHHGHPGRCRL